MSDRSVEVSTPSDREVRIERVFDAPRDLVWDAHTKPDLVKRWLTGPPGNTLPICEIDLRESGAMRYVWRGPDGTDMTMTGTFRAVRRPERLVYSESYEDFPESGESLVTTLFTEEAGKTRVSMTVQYPTRAARDQSLEFGMAEGMAASYASLDAVVAEQA